MTLDEMYNWIRNFRTYVQGRNDGNLPIYVGSIDENILEHIENALNVIRKER